MKSFDVIFNCMFLAVMGYQVLYFLVQYAVLKRIELFYYSMFLLSASTYYYIFSLSPLLNISFHPGTKAIFSTFQMSFAFIQAYFYIVFIIAYLGLEKSKSRAYSFFRFYKYYNLVLIFIFLFLSIFNIESKHLFGIVAILAFPFYLIMLFLMRGLYTTYSNIVVLGTTCIILGSLASFAVINYETYSHIKLPFNTLIPAQAGLLFDLFILGYGLSLKAAESDKKLVKSLQENQKLLEVERSRLARDLHDGLGGLLSGIKLTLASIPANMVLPGKIAAVFTRALSQLDNAIAEMRRVAHSMMPGALVRFGLSEAIQNYCDGINESNAVKMNYMQAGSLQMLNQSTEIAVYRIIQELTNNAIKHAVAKNIFVKLTQQQRGITLIVEDDGKGFDTRLLSEVKGAGLQNVRSRVDCLKGSFTAESEQGRGTSVIIKMPINKYTFSST